MSEIQAVVIGGNRFPFHQLERIGPSLRRAINADGISVELTTDRDELCDPTDYDVLIDYTTDSTFTDDQRSGLLSFVENGGGYVGIHCAADLTTVADGTREEPFPDLRALLGGHFLTHPEQGTFDVNIVDSHHPVSAGLSGFTVWDEPYVVAHDDVRVLARMDHPENGDMPVAWVKPYGDGRVFYCSLGHGQPAFATDGVRSLLVRGIRWAGSK
ncbi:ThuA domain-containing protein [Halocatena pleomorpha]|uniref:ThuA domain-containing protein n=1 Tax=Halocatena pleomorpha TaxID=1785090 RepID=A0A3P3RB10_9EURY|nr:ThuA domain-containing protein [Halocatena pleomorpha]RRJ30118.1 ThuA domain-containing protein [Halocatena pleomorpha]